MKKLALLLSALALALVGLAACGSDDETSTTAATATESSTTESSTTAGGGGGGGETVKFTADPGGALAYTETDVTAKAGNDTIEFDNPASVEHNVEIEDADGNDVAGTDTISASTTSTTANLEPGTYTFYCSVDAHREAGMEGTLTVN